MFDDPMQHAPADRSHINVKQDYEVQYWCHELDITPQELRLLVQQHGTSADKIRDVLGLKKPA
jgi:hypothetical protein